jgi:hypothetical protein
MKKKLTALIPCLAVLASDFYLLPLLMQDTGSAMFLMLCVMPLAAFLTGAVHGLRRGFSLLLPLAALLLFLPTIFLFYNSSAWVYAPAYALIVLAGNGAGKLFRGKR